MIPRSAPRLLPLLALLCAGTLAAETTAADPRSYEDGLAEITAFGMRAENSPVERSVISYIEERLRAAGLDPLTRDFSASRGGYSASRIVEALIPGASTVELTIIAPLNSWYDASSAGEGAAGLAFALSEAERIAASGAIPALSLRFVFLGAERRGRRDDGEAASLGSRAWIASAPSQTRRAVLYLDLDAGFGSLGIDNAGEGRLSPLWLFNRVRSSIEGTGLDPELHANRTILYRLGLADRYGPAAPYIAAGIPALRLQGGTLGSGNPSGLSLPREPIGGELLSRFLDLLVAANAQGFPEAWDFHYIAFEIGGFSATIRETDYVAFIVALTALVAIIALILSIVRRADAKPFISRMPLIIGRTATLYLALSAVILAGNAVSLFDSLALGSTDSWLIAPRVFAAARILSSMLLFLALVAVLVERRLVTANPYAYQFSALLCLVFDVFAFSAVNLPVSLLFVWAFLVALLSLGARKAWLTILAGILLLAPLAPLAVELAVQPEFALLERILRSGVPGAFGLAAFVLPFFAFMTSPFLFVAPRGAPARRRTAALLASAAVMVEALALVVAAQAGMPGPGTRFYRGAAPTIDETIDQDRGLFEARLRGTRRLGSGTLSRGSIELHYAGTSDEVLMSGRDDRPFIEFRVTRQGFLDRRSEKITIAFAQPPFSLRLTLRGANELRIYDCDLPCRVALEGRSAEVFAPVNPGMETSFTLTVPRGFEAELLAEALYLEPLELYAFPDGSRPAYGSFTVRAATSLRGED